METLTAKVDDELTDQLADVAEDEFDGNRSKAVRELLRRGLEHDDLKRENKRLRRQYRQLVEQREDVSEIVEYVEEEKTLREQERRRRDQSFVARMKWLLFGESGE